jgi:Apolipoprotein N-acyltransferase N-terminal domain
MRFTWLWQFLLSLFGGILIALGFPPWNFSWVVWVAFIPVLVSLLSLRGPAIMVILQGVLFSGVFGLITFHWLWHEHRYQEFGTILSVFAIQGMVWSWFVWRFCKLPELAKEDDKKNRKGLQPIFLGAAGNAEAWRVSTAHLRLALLIASSWTFLEWCRGMILTAWNPIGLPIASNLTLLQLVRVTGPFGLSFIAVFANTIIYLAIRRLALRPGRMNWAARFDVVFTLAMLFVIAAAGFQFAQPAPQPQQLRTSITASPGSTTSELNGLLPGVAALKSDLLVWRRITEGGTGGKGLDRAAAPDVGIITGIAAAANAPISGYSVFLPTTVNSVNSFQRPPGFQILADQVPKDLHSVAIKGISLLPLINWEAMSLQALKAGLRAPAQGFVVLVDYPKGTAIGEQHFSANLRCWGVSLGRPITFESDRAGAFMQTGTGRMLKEVAPRTRLLSTYNLDFPLANDMTPYGSFGDWLPILSGALCLVFGLRQRLSDFYESSRRFRT